MVIVNNKHIRSNVVTLDVVKALSWPTNVVSSALCVRDFLRLTKGNLTHKHAEIIVFDCLILVNIYLLNGLYVVLIVNIRHVAN